jgi:hypothetical protein
VLLTTAKPHLIASLSLSLFSSPSLNFRIQWVNNIDNCDKCEQADIQQLAVRHMVVYNLQLAFNPVNVCSLGDMQAEILWFPWAQIVVKVYHNS